MKQLTEAQVMGFRGSMPPLTKHRYSVNLEPVTEECQVTHKHTAARRAIEVCHEALSPHLEMEL